MEIKKTLLLVCTALSVIATLTALLRLPQASMLWEMLFLVLLLVVATLAWAVGWERHPRLTWFPFCLLAVIIAVNGLYVFIRSGMQMFPLFMAIGLFALAAFIIAAAGFISDERAPVRQPGHTEEIIVEGIQPKKMTYIAAINGKKYHDPSCRLAKIIKEEKRVGFVNKGEAEAKKYEPCNLCIE